MKNNNHAFVAVALKKDTIELSHLEMLNHFMSKFDRSVFKKTAKEKQELKNRMYAYPAKHGAPVPPNN